MSEERERPNGLPEGLTGDVRALIEMMGRGGIAELRLNTPDVRLRLRAHGARPERGSALGPADWPERGHANLPDHAPAPDGHLITAPMIGAFYEAASPGEPPFVSVGDLVEPGQTVGIIEAMKIMNEIPADSGGVVAEIFVRNGQPVEYGQPLMRLEPPSGA